MNFGFQKGAGTWEDNCATLKKKKKSLVSAHRLVKKTVVNGEKEREKERERGGGGRDKNFR